MSVRYAKLDGFRGQLIISMILYHCLWDINYIFGRPMAWYQGSAGFLWQQSICWSFILLSGFCSGLESKREKELLRALIIFACGLLISAVTLIFMPDDRVLFGILTFTGSAKLILWLIRETAKKLPPYMGAAFCFVLFFLTRDPERLPLISSLPRNYFSAYLGLPQPGFYSTDYFPLLPWVFLFFTGFYLCVILRSSPVMENLREGRISFLEFTGRYSLLIYMLHQPVMYLLLSLIFK